MTNSTTNRLTELRNLMKKNEIDYYFIPARDEHNDEYLPSCWERRAFISGFTGSAGDVLVGLDSAYLWTDPRYFIQADEELDKANFQLMRQQQGMAAPIHDWLHKNAAHKRVATDPKLISPNEKKLWEAALVDVGGSLVSLDGNLVDALWDDQPARESNPIILLDEQYNGQSTEQKLTALRAALAKHDATAHALNLLDAIAWLFNIRGTDIEYNPLAISYALITQENATLFINEHQVSDAIKSLLTAQGITIQPYEDFASALRNNKQTTLIESTTASWWMEQNLAGSTVVHEPSPITLMKAVKNSTEQQGMREAHRRDGLALCHLFHWLRANWRDQTELSVADKVTELRAKDDHFRGPSFSTISAYAAHGAIPHYFVTPASDIALGDDTLFLIDSGGQYFEGTTDVTRVVHLGTPSADHIHHYTLVLKGHLALRGTLFPHGTCGEQLNALAHRPMWNEGLDFGHGTGHGVGCYLCVHEGPQRISGAYTHAPLVPGMIVSNEPGLYFEGKHGIRIENLLLIVEKISVKDSETGHGPFYGFEDLTLYPYERALIDKNSLSSQEIDQVNNYHERVYATLHNDLPKEIQNWLKSATAPL
ncbi:MAG: Xaa-Pro aminopeptidase [Coxiella sp. (in: Bacteria)]|nr:MAG: Xaa-Pro aminopeptidase [Coxiella sp. (in: g-proteobacteria)]